jgi:hypothetical protein
MSGHACKHAAKASCLCWIDQRILPSTLRTYNLWGETPAAMHTHFKQSKPQQGGRNDRLMPIHDCLKNLKWGRRICMVMALASSLFLMRRSAVKRHAARHAGAGRELGEEAHASQGRVQAQGRVEDWRSNGHDRTCVRSPVHGRRRGHIMHACRSIQESSMVGWAAETLLFACLLPLWDSDARFWSPELRGREYAGSVSFFFEGL